jgi:hypothetical protein
MARQKIEHEIEALRRQREQLDAKLKAAEAKQKQKEFEQSERRKMVVGTIVLEFMAANPSSDVAHAVSDLLDKQVTRPADRALFPALVPAASAARPGNSEPKSETSRPE